MGDGLCTAKPTTGESQSPQSVSPKPTTGGDTLTREDSRRGSKRESAQARSTHSEPPFDFKNSEVKEGEILPANVPGKPTHIPHDWQPSGDEWAYAAAQKLTGDEIEREAQAFRDWAARKGIKSFDWAAEWRSFLRNVRHDGSQRSWRRSTADVAMELALEAEARETRRHITDADIAAELAREAGERRRARDRGGTVE